MRRIGWGLRRDTTETPIIAALRKVGCQVMQLDKFDLLIWNPRSHSLHMLDAKTGKARPTEKQDALLREGWPLRFVATVEEAFEAVGMQIRGEIR